MKWFITDYKKQYLYGDCHLEEDGLWFPWIGSRISVKILGLFWITYKEFKKRQFMENEDMINFPMFFDGENRPFDESQPDFNSPELKDQIDNVY